MTNTATLDTAEKVLAFAFANAKDESDRLHQWSHKTDGQMRLEIGELTAQEIRTVRAVLKAIIGKEGAKQP